MQLIRKDLASSLKDFGLKILTDNLFLLSSSISYYSALAIAPFMLIILWVASIMGSDVQKQIVDHVTQNFSTQVGSMIAMIFNNVNEGVDIGSISGIIGVIFLLWTCSLVFLQFRYAFDVIYDYHDPHGAVNVKEWAKEKLFAMAIVLIAAALLILSFTVVAVVSVFISPQSESFFLSRAVVFLLNFVIYLVLFSMIHYFTPSKRQKPKHVLKIAVMTSAFFIIGNLILASYLRSFAGNSVYGAAGTVLVFLVWCYYSSFVIFLSVEVFQFLKKRGIIGV